MRIKNREYDVIWRYNSEKEFEETGFVFDLLDICICV